MRFHPPTFQISPWLRYVIQASFAAPGVPIATPEGIKGEREVRDMVSLLARTGLAPRLETRVPARILGQWLGIPGHVALLARAEAQRQRSRRAGALADLLAANCERLGIDALFLKFCGVWGRDPSVAHRRPSVDVDVLIHPADETPFLRLLEELGLVPRSGSTYQSPDGMSVDLHGSIPGLRLGRTESVGLAELLDLGLTEPWRPGLRHIHRLDRSTRVAVTVVHALAHHGVDPQSYRLLLAIADLLDEGVEFSEAEEIAVLAAPDVPRDETLALVGLTERLRRGDADLFETGGETLAENTLLRHFVSPLLGDVTDRAKLDWLFFAFTREPVGSGWVSRALRVAFVKRPGDRWIDHWIRPIRLSLTWAPRVLKTLHRIRWGKPASGFRLESDSFRRGHKSHH